MKLVQWMQINLANPLLSVNNLSVSYSLPAAHLFAKKNRLQVLSGISFKLAAGQSLGIVGESGSGKTTLGRALVKLIPSSSGTIMFNGVELTAATSQQIRSARLTMQMIFQDPQSSLNPRRRIGHIVTQPLLAFNRLENNVKRHAVAGELLQSVGLEAAMVDRFPHELSGGQRQRVGIARAIGLKPKLIVADEIVSGLDVSSQAQILLLLEQLKEKLGLAMVFISHDLSVVRKLCDHTLVLQHGRIVEHNQTGRLFEFARHPYTRELIRAVPLPEIDSKWFDEPVDSTQHRGMAMQIKGATVLVTGANRGIGACFIDELLKRGVKKIYATARDPSAIKKRATTLEVHALDITDHCAIESLAIKLTDVDLLINNAGVNNMSAFAASENLQAARDEMEVNYFGTLAMCKAFAPVLKNNQGGAMINMLSILARVNLPLMGSLCASKAAGLSLVQGLRAELAAQSTAVIAVMPGAVDTDMSKNFPPPKMAPLDVVCAALDGLEQGLEEIYPGEMAAGMQQGLAADSKAVEKELAHYLPG